jgi:hypothetical protein
MGANTPLLAMLFTSLLLLASFILLFVGWRGRVVGTQPVCRKCGFDLTGRPETSTACPECGTDLGKPTAIRVGHHYRRRGLLGTGAFLLLIGGFAAAVVGTTVARDADFNRYKPLWLLRWDVGSSDDIVRGSATRELTGRIAGGSFSDATLKELADHALSLQADRSQKWQEGWGDVLEAVHDAGKLPDADWLRYIKQAVDLTLEVPAAQDRSAGSLPYWLVLGPSRVGSDTRFRAEFESRNQTIWVSGIKPPPRNGESTGSTGLGSAGTMRSGTSVWIAPLMDKLKDGPQTMRIQGTLTVFNARGPSGAPPVLTIPFDLTEPWTLQPTAPAPAPKKQ